METVQFFTNTQFTFLIAWCVGALLLGWCITFAIIRKHPGQVNTALKDGLLPKLMTIILVLLATTVLALADKLTEAVAAIFSGIVGYVLGTTNLSQQKSSKELPLEKPEED